MIADVIGDYLDSLAGREREFDAPFMALLRANDYADIHFLHGKYEFGKDFIAKGYDEGVLCQFTFQTKAGDLGLNDWREARNQIEELRWNSLSHPSFDAGLPRRAIFVTTGRLTGGAPLDAQQYAGHLERQSQTGFKVWDREDLIAMMSGSPELGLAGSAEGPLLKILGKIDESNILEKELEQFSRRWIVEANSLDHLWKSAVEAAVVANRLRRHERLDLACFISLCLVRAAWACAHGIEPPHDIGRSAADLGRSLFLSYSSALWERCDEELLDPLAFIHGNEQEIPVSFVTYPVRCMRLVEALGLLGILKLEAGEPESREIIDYLVRFFERHPGAAHPISDRWAVSLIPPILLLSRATYKDEAAAVLTEATRWVSNHHEREAYGLAGPYATPDEEVDYLLGTPFEHVQLERRSESFISTIILDLAALLEMGGLYELARNEFLAVKAMSCVVETGDTRSQYLLDSSDLSHDPNVPYEDNWRPVDGWKVAPHHSRGPSSYYLERIGRHWDHLAVSAVLRDRHFPQTYRALVNSRPSSDVHS